MAVVVLFHAVAVLSSSALAASNPEAAVSAAAVHPVRGSGAAVVTATGTARGITCLACASAAAAGAPADGWCSATATPVIRNNTAEADSLARTRIFTPVWSHYRGTSNLVEASAHIPRAAR